MREVKKVTSYSSWFRGKVHSPQERQGEWKVFSPENIETEIAICEYAYSQIEDLVAYSSSQQLEWSRVKLKDRHAILVKELDRLLAAKELWIEIARQELGRTDEDLLLELSQLERWSLYFKSFSPLEQEPRGVSAVIASVVSPLFYSTHFTFLNLLAGNTVVLKPSEKATLTTLKWAQILTESGALSSVLQVLVGEREMGRRLICHEQIQTVIFMGSFEAGMRVKQDTLSQTAKEILLFLGAKNISVLGKGFPRETIDVLLKDCFLGTGQNCRSVSTIFVPQSEFSSFVETFHEKAKNFSIGPASQKSFMGPFLDQMLFDRYLKFVGISEREGAQVIMRGKPILMQRKGFFATPTLVAFEQVTPEMMKKSISLQTEILSPHVSVIQYAHEEEVLAVQHQMNYGLCASLWGENETNLKGFAHELKVGQVSLNQSLLLQNFEQSFQARKKSGNHAFHGFKIYEQLTSALNI